MAVLAWWFFEEIYDKSLFYVSNWYSLTTNFQRLSLIIKLNYLRLKYRTRVHILDTDILSFLETNILLNDKNLKRYHIV